MLSLSLNLTENLFSGIVLPVYFENDDEKYPYSFRASSIRVDYKDKRYIVTARHVTKDGGWDINKLFVPIQFGNRMCTKLVNEYSLREIEILDKKYDLPDETDLVAYELGNMPPEVLLPRGIAEDQIIDRDLNPSNELLILGYPSLLNSIDYEKQLIKQYLKAYKGSFIASINPVLSRISVSNGEDEKLDGVSGGVVFSNRKFCGMMTKSDEQMKSGLSQYIDARLIIRFIEQCYRENDA